MFLAFGVLAAVESRHRTGLGQRVETSLLEAATSLAVYESAHYFATGTRPARIGQAHRGSSPYQCFATSDGHITVGASQPKFFAAFCAAASIFTPIPANQASQSCACAGIPAGPVLHYDEVFTDPHILAREMVARTDHPVTGPFHTLGVTVKLSDTPGSVRLPAPRLGEHTAEVLGERRAAAE